MLTVLLSFFFPRSLGLTKATRELARDIAKEHGLVWKIWLEDRELDHAGQHLPVRGRRRRRALS